MVKTTFSCTTKPFVPTEYWDEVFEDQPIPPGLYVQMNTRTDKKHARQPEKMQEHVFKNTNLKEFLVVVQT